MIISCAIAATGFGEYQPLDVADTDAADPIQIPVSIDSWAALRGGPSFPAGVNSPISPNNRTAVLAAMLIHK